MHVPRARKSPSVCTRRGGSEHRIVRLFNVVELALLALHLADPELEELHAVCVRAHRAKIACKQRLNPVMSTLSYLRGVISVAGGSDERGSRVLIRMTRGLTSQAGTGRAEAQQRSGRKPAATTEVLPLFVHAAKGAIFAKLAVRLNVTVSASGRK